ERLQVVDGWLVGDGVQRIEMHASWRYSWLSTPEHKPLAIVAHYTDTDPGTAVNMAKRRQQPWATFAAAYRKSYPGKPVPQNSWHLSIEADGSIVQMAPLTSGCWHVGSPTAKQIPGVGWGNRTAVGIELVGHGKTFPPAQVSAACDVWRAIVRAYGIPREHAMVTHQSIDPTRRSDPGPVWMKQHAPTVLERAFA
ncbi:MAG: N-acetylmuramoyl-L-alanine amidase, partial [Kofleriaceae bacterium]|nr:N-acetylmuramoyl-L-alanine amidase [Kofleriaceae bacterium]